MKYSLTPEHRARFAGWRDKWIANAMSTKAMTQEDREACCEAVLGLYAAAKLAPPKHIVFVPSPFVLAFAGGFSAAIWHKFKGGAATDNAIDAATYAATDNATDAATYGATRAATDAATDNAIDAATRAATGNATDAATRAATCAATGDATDAATRAATCAATGDATDAATCAATGDATYAAIDAATYGVTRAATYAAIDAATYNATCAAIDAATYNATRAATRAATGNATDAATYNATRAATDAATYGATRAATYNATDAATYGATRAATDAATDAATYNATRAATDAATYGATDNATRAAIDAATYNATGGNLDRWYVVPGDLRRLADDLGVGSFGLRCAATTGGMWQGGNQWSGYDCFLSFFQEVVGLGLPEYEHYRHWRTLAERSGPRIMHSDFCMISDRPEVLTVDDQNRPHAENGPFCQWRDGTGLYSWHGTRIPARWIEDRETLDPNEVIKADDVEQRAAGAAIVGWPRMLSVLNAKVIDDSGSPDIGQLIELTLPGLDQPGRFLKAHCPRNGIICEGVPRVSDIDGLPIDTALAAQAWRIGDPQAEYSHPPLRT